MPKPPPRTDKRRRLLARWTIVSIAATVVVAAIVVWLSRPDVEVVAAAGAKVEGLTSVLKKSASREEVPFRFEDVTEQMGISFTHMPFARASLLPEDMGSGIACGDYDGDGFTDLYFVNFSNSAVNDAPSDNPAACSKLFRNVDGRRFEDVTEPAGVGFCGFGMGAAWGDHDGDGDLDLYVTAFGPNALYENRGDGTFVDATQRSGLQDARFSAGAAWSDFDGDDDLDLYICNYVNFVYREDDRQATERQYATEQPFTLNPSSYAPQANALFRNNGDGTFKDIAESAGVSDPTGRSLSACWADLNNDGKPDLYVANDVSNNAVFLNRCTAGTIAFEDVGAASLAADYRGAMGIAVADFDDDLDQDLLITHWIAQENALYVNMIHDASAGDSEDQRLWFVDDADSFGLGQVSLDMVGWATGFSDFDNDGRLDLWLVNGSTMEQRSDHTRLQAQPSFLFWNRGEQGFVNVAEYAAPPLATPAVRRGGAHLDFDRDGRVDLVTCEHGGTAMLLRNTTQPAGNWIRLRLTQPNGSAPALGARAYVEIGGKRHMAEVGASASYLSHDERTLHFGLGSANAVDTLEIVWPGGFIDTRSNVPANQELVFVRGAADSSTGAASAPEP